MPSNVSVEADIKTMNAPWIGVDLDGTLAMDMQTIQRIGPILPAMKYRVLEWLREGYEVRIFTARANVPEQIPAILAWLEKNGLPPLKITACKDFGCLEYWDDRAVHVRHNRGNPCFPHINPHLYIAAELDRLLSEGHSAAIIADLARQKTRDGSIVP